MTHLQLGVRMFGEPDTALFSDDEVYRWELKRELGGEIVLAICGLNPSTANAFKNDQTISTEMAFAKIWGCGRLHKVNAYGFRATDPKVMRKAAQAGFDVIGEENDAAIVRALEAVKSVAGSIFLVAWGKNIGPERQRELAALIAKHGVTPMCLGTNKDGTPKHPLYQPHSTPLVPWELPRAA